jgi:hypothetical protein
MKPHIILTLIVAISGSAFAAAAGDLEVPPDQSPGALLTAAEVSGDGFHVQDPVHSDGLMPHYVIESSYGEFAAYGHNALVGRLREVAALRTLEKTSDADVVMKSVGRGIHEDVSAFGKVAKNPVGTIVGIPRGISHLLGGYRAEAQEVKQKAGDAVNGSGPQSSGNVAARTTKQTEALAKQYADRYLGLSAAERRWYEKLGVDPYTNNEVLRRAVTRLSKIDAATSLGMRFAPVGIPFAGEVRRAVDAIYSESPAVLRKRRHDALLAFGLSPEEVKQFENTLLLNPTRQTLLVNAVTALNGVEGRAELLRHAASVTTEDEIGVFLQSTGLLVQAHAHHPVTRILAGLRLPTAQLADGRVAVFGAFDAVYWTDDIAADEKVLREFAAPGAAGLDVWVGGSVSPRALAELQKRGWTVHDHADAAPAVRPGA